MASLGLANPPVHCSTFMPTLKIQGKLYHRIGSLLPAANRKLAYAQLYFVDSKNETRNRLSFKGADTDLNENILLDLRRALHMHNPYIKSFKEDIFKEYSAAEKCSTDDIISHDKRVILAGSHERTYNPPTTSEVAVIMVGNDTNNQDVKPADIVVHFRASNGNLDYISKIHRSYDPLHSIIFPCGESGWNVFMKDNDRSKNITECDFYSYRFQRYISEQQYVTSHKEEYLRSVATTNSSFQFLKIAL
ncbi:Hypothetical predicted protein [Octopus vulgaris]|uniref:Helitron helicase-like domain-containing protein n=1 Tax=Octopus vulgaris TaxID=6645 RepID=A0AA36B4J1_OCTVU|nr:Hypothetical predicted protein [Octopus vulgaris]